MPRTPALGFGLASVASAFGGTALADDGRTSPEGAAPPPATPPAAGARDERPCCFGFEVPKLTFEALATQWRPGAYAAFDAIAWDGDNARDDEVRATDLRPILEGRSGRFSLRVEGDAVGVDTPRNLYEAWAAWEFAPWLRVSAGQFRVPLSSEFATHERDLPFVGYGFPAHLNGRYDWGARIDGNAADGLWVQATATAGHGFGLEGHRITSPQFTVRGVAHPLRLGGVREGDALAPLLGFYVGGALAKRTDGDDPIKISTPLQSRVFDTRDLDGEEGQWVHVEFGWIGGPFQLGVERTEGSTDDVPVPGGDRTDMDQLTAFSWFGAWNLTGEPRGWKDGAFVPAAGSRPADGAFSFLPEGRWELAARYSNADIDRDLFDAGITTYDPSSQETRTVSVALFWTPCETLRLGVGWVKTIADDELTTFGGDKRDSSFALRVELRF